MKHIDARGCNFRELNQRVWEAGTACTLEHCCGQRFIAAGMAEQTVVVRGIPGNALGAYLNGASITVWGNAQDAVGDTMNAGQIVVHGSIGDAAGYAMRGGKIFVQGDAGYRAGIHMKAYENKIPLMVIGGVAGSFLGEYQAGGRIVVLGLEADGRRLLGNFPCTGMHGGKLFLRGDCRGLHFPAQVQLHPAGEEDLAELRPIVAEYAALFDRDAAEILNAPFTVVTPNGSNPYKLMYVAN